MFTNGQKNAMHSYIQTHLSNWITTNCSLSSNSDNIADASSITIFPNPATEVIRFNGAIIVSASIFDMAGKELITKNILDLMETSAVLIKTNKLFMFGAAFVILGFCFKVSIAPFHFWTPDVYQGAPTPVTSFMATAIKAASFAAFMRLIVSKGLVGSENLFIILQWFAVITMTVGNVAALVQNNFKRTLAYSSISHSGYILVGVIAAGISNNSAFAAGYPRSRPAHTS